MKKVLVLILILLLSACGNNGDVEYYQKVEELQNITQSSENIPFSIDITVNKLTDDELSYHVIIDNPLVDVRNMKVLVVHDVMTDAIFPSVGIVDESVSLTNDKDKVDLENNIVKGIALVGYLPIDINSDILFKILIEYLDEKNNKETVYYVSNVTLKDIENL